MNLKSQLYEWFWNEKFWLPENYSFKDIPRSNNDGLTLSRHLPFVVAALVVARIVYNYCIKCLCSRWGLDDDKPKVNSEPALDDFYKTTKRPSDNEILILSKRLDMTQRRIYLWFQRRRSLDKPGLPKKLSESSWRFIFYTLVFSFGFYSLKSTPWFWDTSYCWQDFPVQSVQSSIEMYYLLQLSFYLSLLITLLSDIRRSDFYEQVIHHIATITLISISYANNGVRMGSLIMIVHDAADVFLEASKCVHYLKFNTLADIGFVCFTLVFYITRLYIFPFYIVRAASVDNPFIRCPSHTLSVVLLLVLQVLHLFWAKTIFDIAKRLVRGDNATDLRSDDESE
uniref:Homeobox domain-containing protein n=1 Tax=Ciona savignyi TaxID=51511 RepID=H2ZGJ8_CIOSA